MSNHFHGRCCYNQVIFKESFMSLLLRSLVAAALVTGTGAAQDPPKQDPPKKDQAKQEAKPGSLAEEMAVVEKELEQLQQEARKKFQAAKDPKEKTKIRDEFMAIARKKSLDIAKKYPKDPMAFQLFVGSNSKEGFDLLLQHWINDEKIGLACLQVGQQASPAGIAFVRAVREKATDDKVKGVATVALALALKSQAEEDDKEAPKLLAEAEKIFTVIERDHAKLETPMGPAGEYAKRNLFEIRHLAVGKTAPDLAGKDLEDKPMKLSDYRGKVILLDFWAHW
jgi:hypothetical protein